MATNQEISLGLSSVPNSNFQSEVSTPISRFSARSGAKPKPSKFQNRPQKSKFYQMKKEQKSEDEQDEDEDDFESDDEPEIRPIKADGGSHMYTQNTE